MVRLSTSDKRVKDICKFLLTSSHILKLNFRMNLSKNYKIYPGAFRNDVRMKIGKGDIGIVIDPKLDRGGRSRAQTAKKITEAQYHWMKDDLHISKRFTIRSLDHQQTLLHECTHAHFDIQAIRVHPIIEAEALAYVVEAVFLSSAFGKTYLPGLMKEAMKSSDKIQKESYKIAARILKGTYKFGKNDLTNLLDAVKLKYNAKGFYDANGVRRRYRKGTSTKSP